MKNKIHVISFDFDGCMSVLDMAISLARGTAIYKDILEGHDPLLKKLMAERSAFQQTYGFVGSNRQSESIDEYNGEQKGNGSCMAPIKRLCDHIGAEFDSFLLADIMSDLPDGTSFNRIIDKDYSGSHANWKFDEHKATILYAQIHRMANKAPNAEIIFDFYDDRMDILNSLRDFYTKYPDLLPKNVTLRLYKYASSHVDHLNDAGVNAGNELATIAGQGFIDTNYKETVKEMGSLVPALGGMINVAQDLDPAALTQRTALTDLAQAPVTIVPKRKLPSLPAYVKLSSGTEISAIKAKKTIFDFILRTIQNEGIETRKEISCDKLPNREAPFVAGYFHESKRPYIGDQFFSATVNKQGNLELYCKDITSGDWISLSDDDQIMKLFAQPGLFNAILEASLLKKTNVSVADQGMFNTKLSDDQKDQIDRVSQFIFNECNKRDLQRGARIEVTPGFLNGQSAACRLGRSYETDTYYASNQLISARFNASHQLEFYKSKLGDGHNWSRISDKEALQYDLVKDIAAYQVKQPVEKETCTIS